MVKIKTRCRISIWRTFGEFHGMSSQSHLLHCRVLPPGEFNVMIPVPCATLQGAVTWRNQCYDHVTLQGIRIPSAILKIVIRHIFFVFLQFGLRRAAAFVSSPIHLFRYASARLWNQFPDSFRQPRQSCPN